MDKNQPPSGGAPGPPKESMTPLVGDHSDHAHELRALAILAIVVFGFLTVAAILYMLRWVCIQFSGEKHAVSAESPDIDEGVYSERLERTPAEEDKGASHSEQVSDSESTKRCYPSPDKMFELNLAKKKREREKEKEGVSLKILKAVPDYSKIVLKQDEMYVGGLSKHPKVPPSYISTLEMPGTRKVLWAPQSISGATVLKTARSKSARKSSSIDKMKIVDAPILTAPKKSAKSPAESSIKTAVEVYPPETQSTPQTQIAAVSAQLTPLHVAQPMQPLEASPGMAPILASQPMETTQKTQPKPFSSSNLMISGEASVRTASRAEGSKNAAAVKITAAPVIISAMRRRPLPKEFKKPPEQRIVQKSNRTKNGQHIIEISRISSTVPERKEEES
ncbi:hypothetical protein RB195_017243 [Necator americanus]|uniref:Uncharacterized protein n=1 Tax=Necator americanus TaxID=51031 RepID=A0ABR1C4C6_NECAM